MNVCILRGRLLRPPEQRVLPGGRCLVTYELSVARADAPAEPVPVVWESPPASVLDLEVEAEVVVVGRVRRRKFRSGGSSQSRTEVVADAVLPARSAKRAARLVSDAVAVVEEAIPRRSG
ncbi:hypothetical protein BH18ACT1_BH18ACT1_18180 [soil metagenome]